MTLVFKYLIKGKALDVAEAPFTARFIVQIFFGMGNTYLNTTELVSKPSCEQ